jgi:hypothetical protein
MQYCTILCSTVLYYVVLYYTVQYCTILCSTVLYYAVLYYTVQYRTPFRTIDAEHKVLFCHFTCHMPNLDRRP